MFVADGNFLSTSFLSHFNLLVDNILKLIDKETTHIWFLVSDNVLSSSTVDTICAVANYFATLLTPLIDSFFFVYRSAVSCRKFWKITKSAMTLVPSTLNSSCAIDVVLLRHCSRITRGNARRLRKDTKRCTVSRTPFLRTFRRPLKMVGSSPRARLAMQTRKRWNSKSRRFLSWSEDRRNLL